MTSEVIAVPTSVKSRQRIPWIDIAKGIGIMLVSFGHMGNGRNESIWLPALQSSFSAIYLFHMPLFFFLGGFTFSNRRPFRSFIANKAKTLLIPYYIFSVYYLAKPIATLLVPNLGHGLQTSIDYTQNVGSQFYSILINGSGLWFLWAYFIGEVIVYPITKLINLNWQRILTGSLLISFSLSFPILFPGVILPFQIVSGIEVAGFILFGIACKEWLCHCTQRDALIVFAMTAFLFVIAAILVLQNANNPYYIAAKIFPMFLGVFASVFLAIGISHSNWLEHIGRHSLSFYVVNVFTMNIGKILFFNILHINGTQAPVLMQWVYGLLLLAFCTVLLWIEDYLIRRFIPWSLGIFTRRPIITDAI